MPDFSTINMYSFGLLGVFVSFLIPYFIMEKKGVNNQKILAGLTSLSLYLMLLIPDFSEDGEAATFVFERFGAVGMRSEEHTSELQSRGHLVCRLLLEKKNKI